MFRRSLLRDDSLGGADWARDGVLCTHAVESVVSLVGVALSSSGGVLSRESAVSNQGVLRESVCAAAAAATVSVCCFISRSTFSLALCLLCGLDFEAGDLTLERLPLALTGEEQICFTRGVVTMSSV